MLNTEIYVPGVVADQSIVCVREYLNIGDYLSGMFTRDKDNEIMSQQKDGDDES